MQQNKNSLAVDNRGIVTQNLFQYCANNPIMYSDYSGKLFGAIVKAFFAVIGSISMLSGCTSENSSESLKEPTPLQPPKQSIPEEPIPMPNYEPSQEEKIFAATVYAEAAGVNRKSK